MGKHSRMPSRRLLVLTLGKSRTRSSNQSGQRQSFSGPIFSWAQERLTSKDTKDH